MVCYIIVEERNKGKTKKTLNLSKQPAKASNEPTVKIGSDKGNIKVRPLANSS